MDGRIISKKGMRAMSKRVIDLKVVWEQCVGIAAKQPDAVYRAGFLEKCRYTRGRGGDGCGCLLGQGFIAAYPFLKPILQEIDVVSACSVSSLINVLRERFDCEFVGDRAKYLGALRRTQEEQDQGSRWARAVAAGLTGSGVPLG